MYTYILTSTIFIIAVPVSQNNTGGLSVFTFLRIRTWMNIEDKAAAQSVVRDCIHLARMEGLEGHARAAECRLIEEPAEEGGGGGGGGESSPAKKAKK